jgi:hypothetical protein
MRNGLPPLKAHYQQTSSEKKSQIGTVLIRANICFGLKNSFSFIVTNFTLPNESFLSRESRRIYDLIKTFFFSFD